MPNDYISQVDVDGTTYDIKDTTSGYISTVVDTYSSTGSDAVSGKAVNAALQTLDSSVSAESGKAISSITITDGKISASTKISIPSDPMIFKGTIGQSGGSGTISAVPTSGVTIGDTYKIIEEDKSISASASATGSAVTAKIGDTIIATATTPLWVVIPSGDEPSGTVTSVAVSNATNGGLSVTGSPITSSGTISIGHSNVLSSAQTTSAVYPIKIDKNGHISYYGSAVTSMTPTSHTHGNITNGGDITTTTTIASGDRLVINDESASKIDNSSITFGSSTTTFLANNGTWQTPQTSGSSIFIVTTEDGDSVDHDLTEIIEAVEDGGVVYLYVTDITVLPSDIQEYLQGADLFLSLISASSSNAQFSTSLYAGDDEVLCIYAEVDDNGAVAFTLAKSITPVSTYSSTGISAVNGTAVNAALQTLDSSITAETGKAISAVTITDGKISAHTKVNVGETNTVTDIQVNGTSVLSSKIANLVTNTAYNSSSNKIATMSDIPTITSSYSSSGTNAVNGTAVNAALQTLDSSITAETGKAISAITITDGKIASSSKISVPTVTSSYSSSGTDPVNGTAVNAALQTLDSSITAESNKAISAITITDGKIASSSKISVPTKTSDITNDSGYLTSYTETDPTVPSWAKASTKPSYTASEVGAVPTTRTVNGKALSSDISLTASDVSATGIFDGAGPSANETLISKLYMEDLGSSQGSIVGLKTKFNLLWTNSAPASSFSSQTVEVDLSEYEFVLICCRGYRTQNANRPDQWNLIKVGQSVPQELRSSYGMPNRTNVNRIVESTSSSGIVFGAGYGNTAGTADTSACIPLYIVGF